jgi:hypothetical protein
MIENEEQWEPIQGFERYQVSTFGRIKNIKTNKFMKPTKKCGYMHVCLVNNLGKKCFKIHRLVMLAFQNNPENKPEVNHKDKNKTNNHLYNLEWNTRSENTSHSKSNAIIITNKNKPVNRINKNTDEIIDKYQSIHLAAEWVVANKLTKNLHNGRNAIGNSISGLTKSSYGFKWELQPVNEVLPGEVWKQVVPDNVQNINVNKLYFVSSLGRFKNSYGTIMNNYKVNENGYIRVFIYNKITALLHRLVACAFILNPNNKLQVNHIDGNKLNNSIENLEWVTNEENQVHKFKIGLGNNYTRKIIQYDLEMNEIKKFDSIKHASKELDINQSNIRNNLIKKTKSSSNFIFIYQD